MHSLDQEPDDTKQPAATTQVDMLGDKVLLLSYLLSYGTTGVGLHTTAFGLVVSARSGGPLFLSELVINTPKRCPCHCFESDSGYLLVPDCLHEHATCLGQDICPSWSLSCRQGVIRASVVIGEAPEVLVMTHTCVLFGKGQP